MGNGTVSGKRPEAKGERAVDKIFENWFEVAMGDVERLASESDRLDVTRLSGNRLLAHFSCKGFVLGEGGRVEECDRAVIGFHIADDYLRRSRDSMEVLSWLAPHNAFHPNIRENACCIGKVAAGTSLVELLQRTYAVITWQEVMPDEFNALNPAACAFARNHPERVPVDARPLKNRPLSFQLGELEVSS